MSITDQHAHVAALAALPHMGPAGLRRLLQHHTPYDAWMVATGRCAAAHPEVAQLLATSRVAGAWRAADPGLPAQLAERCTTLGVRVLLPTDDDYPALVSDDPHAPAALFVRGDLHLLQHRRVGVIGTRHPTATGRATAIELGRGLAHQGIAVVSGLARGIDGAAHQAVIEVGGVPIGVVASGLDVVYPREHANLWEAVATTGVLMSELPPGVRPEAFRFPLRNRLLAMLSEVVVVVESKGSGGSLITADEAARRGRLVMAVPGSVRNPAAQGTNDLLADGAVPARDLTDVLVALGLQNLPVAPAPPPTATLEGLDHRIDDLLRDGGRCLDDLLHHTGRPLGELLRSLTRLEANGHITVTDGWFERRHSPWGQR